MSEENKDIVVSVKDGYFYINDSKLDKETTYNDLKNILRRNATYKTAYPGKDYVCATVSIEGENHLFQQKICIRNGFIDWITLKPVLNKEDCPDEFCDDRLIKHEISMKFLNKHFQETSHEEKPFDTYDRYQVAWGSLNVHTDFRDREMDLHGVVAFDFKN